LLPKREYRSAIWIEQQKGDGCASCKNEECGSVRRTKTPYGTTTAPTSAVINLDIELENERFAVLGNLNSELYHTNYCPNIMSLSET
jgi:hypothetical protein